MYIVPEHKGGMNSKQRQKRYFVDLTVKSKDYKDK